MSTRWPLKIAHPKVKDTLDKAHRLGELQFVRADSGNRVQATPAYDLARGWQFFVGPFLGVQFGP